MQDQDGRFIVTTEGTERFSINASGEATFSRAVDMVVILMLLVYQHLGSDIKVDGLLSSNNSILLLKILISFKLIMMHKD